MIVGALRNCRICERPVIELGGMYEFLQPYYAADEAHPAFQIAGLCHTPCLVASPFGSVWARWRIAHFKDARGYELLASLPSWTVLYFKRTQSFVAFSDNGCSIAKQHKPHDVVVTCVDGGLIPVEHEVHIGLEDAQLVARIQSRLVAERDIEIRALIEGLGIDDCVQWPQALNGAMLRFSKALQREWAVDSVSAIARYFVFLPDPILRVWKML